VIDLALSQAYLNRLPGKAARIIREGLMFHTAISVPCGGIIIRTRVADR